ncbi:hypothetical protein Aperf_G00000122545 [Anoplocephala perfoliata]
MKPQNLIIVFSATLIQLCVESIPVVYESTIDDGKVIVNATIKTVLEVNNNTNANSNETYWNGTFQNSSTQADSSNNSIERDNTKIDNDESLSKGTIEENKEDGSNNAALPEEEMQPEVGENGNNENGTTLNTDGSDNSGVKDNITSTDTGTSDDFGDLGNETLLDIGSGECENSNSTENITQPNACCDELGGITNETVADVGDGTVGGNSSETAPPKPIPGVGCGDHIFRNPFKKPPGHVRGDNYLGSINATIPDEEDDEQNSENFFKRPYHGSESRHGMINEEMKKESMFCASESQII